MNIQANITYDQALELERAGFDFTGIKEAIDEYHSIKKAFNNSVRPIVINAKNSFSCKKEDKVKYLNILSTHLQELLDTPNIDKYFFADDCSTELYTVYKNLFSCLNKSKFLSDKITKEHDETYDKWSEEFLDFIQDKCLEFQNYVQVNFPNLL